MSNQMRNDYNQPQAVYPPLPEPEKRNKVEDDEPEIEDDFGQYPGDYEFYNPKDRYKKIRAMFKGFQQ